MSAYISINNKVAFGALDETECDRAGLDWTGLNKLDN